MRNFAFAKQKIMDNSKSIEERRAIFWAKIRKAVEDKNALCESDDIEKTAKERGIQLVCPI